MKKFWLGLVTLMLSATANAQYLNDSEFVFNEGKYYISAAASGLDLNYNTSQNWKLDLQAKGGYLFLDDWMITANLGYTAVKHAPDYFRLGAGLRYYFEQNGIYVGAGANYVRTSDEYKDFKPEINCGYAFFLSRTVTIEPELYYEISTKSSCYSGAGLRIGFGIYLE